MRLVVFVNAHLIVSNIHICHRNNIRTSRCVDETIIAFEWALSRLGALTTELEENPLDRPPNYKIERSTGKSEFVTTSGSSGHHSVGGTTPSSAKKTTFTRPVQKDLSDDELSD
jgi:hypothetical protein